MVNACQNSDLNELFLYFSTGKDLSSYVWENYNFFDLWNAVENGATPPERNPCNSSYIASVRSCTLAVLGNFTTTNDFVGFNRDFYNLYLLIIGQEPIITPSFDSNCVARLYSVFSIGLTAKWRQPQELTAIMSKSAALAFVEYQQPQSFDALISKSADLDPVQFLQDQQFNVEFSSFDPDYQAVLDYATTEGYTLPSESQQELQNQLVLDLKADGIWAKLDCFSVFATDGDSDFALIDWIRLSQYTAINSPTFTSNQGFTGDGATSYINTNYNPSTDAVNYSLNSASIGLYSLTSQTSNGFDMGAFDQSGGNKATTFATFRSSSYQATGPNDASQNNSAISDGIGFYHINRNGSSAKQSYKDGTLINSYTDSSVAIPNLDLYLLARNFNGSPALETDNTISLSFVGADLSSEASDFNTVVTNYLNAI